jgi:hypothetical protein
MRVCALVFAGHATALDPAPAKLLEGALKHANTSLYAEIF